MSYEITVKGIPPIEFSIKKPQPKEAPKGFKWISKGLGKAGIIQLGSEYAYINVRGNTWNYGKCVDPNEYKNEYCFYLEAIRTHREDGTPLEIEPLPDPSAYGDNVERIEYATPEQAKEAMENGTADFWGTIDSLTDKSWHTYSNDHQPVGDNHHYLLGHYKKEQTAQEVQKQQAFKVGDRVRVTRKAESGERGCPFIWHENMDFQIGGDLEIRAIKDEIECLKLSDENWYPSFVCELVEPAKPKPTTLEDLVGEDYQKNLWIIDHDGYKYHCMVCEDADGEIWLRATGCERPFGLAEVAAQRKRYAHSPKVAYEDASQFYAQVEGGVSE